MSAGKSEKPPRIKGLVKRCRSFKEDIISRLSKNKDGNATISSSPTSWNSDIPGVEPVSISHRLKEAHLTLQFVESLISKNCMDLLGPTSNVLLDLMGSLLNDLKKASASDSAPYQSAISQVKTALSDFLTSIDVLLLLKDPIDDAQQELYFQKIIETIETTREALNHLKSLIDTKENGHGKTPVLGTSPTKKTSPSKENSNRSLASILTSSQGNVGGGSHSHNHPNPHGSTAGREREDKDRSSSSSKSKSEWELDSASSTISPKPAEEKLPPLPPKSAKLKQWTAKSFDSTIEWSPSGSHHHHPLHSQNNSHAYQYQTGHHHPMSHIHNNNNNNSTSLLSQWLEQSPLPSKQGNSANSSCSSSQQHLSVHRSSTSTSTTFHSQQQQLQSGRVNTNCSSSSSCSGGSHQHVLHHHQQHNHHQSSSISKSKFLELSSTSSLQGQSSSSQNWVDSVVYVGRTSTSSASGNIGVGGHSSMSANKILQNGKKTRTFSDSYRLGSDESLDKMLLVDESRSQSQSLSLGSSLDNLLLVDSNSNSGHASNSGAGLSPNSNSTCGGGNRISVSSNLSCNSNNCVGGMLGSSSIRGHSNSGLSELSHYDPDGDADVFLTDVGGVSKSSNSPSPAPGIPRIIGSGESNIIITEDHTDDDDIPPRLPEKQHRIRHFLLGNNPNPPGSTHSTISPTHSSSCSSYNPNSGNNNNNNNNLSSNPNSNSTVRCPSPYDNVQEGEEVDLALTWQGISSSGNSDSGSYSRQNSTAGLYHREQFAHFQQRQFMSYSESRNTLVGTSMGFSDSDEKPPLPKKKHSLITAYVELMHNFDSHSNSHNHHHHHHFHNHQNSFHYQHGTSSNTSGLSTSNSHHPPISHQYSHQAPLQSYSPYGAGSDSLSPVGGPVSSSVSDCGMLLTSGDMKRASYAQSSSYHQFSSCSTSQQQQYQQQSGLNVGGPGVNPKIPSPTEDQHLYKSTNSNYNSFDNRLHLTTTNSSISSTEDNSGIPGKPPELPPKRGYLAKTMSEQGDMRIPTAATTTTTSVSIQQLNNPVSPVQPPSTLAIANTLSIPVVAAPLTSTTPAHSFSGGESISIESPQRSLDEENIDLYILDAAPSLIMNDGQNSSNSKANCDGPEVKGGEPYVLIVYAAMPNLTDLRFREVFLLTYRSFVRPLDVVTLLWKRYLYFEKKTDRVCVVHGRTTLDLFVDVINSLTPMDLDEEMLVKVRNCIYYLVNNGEIMNALKARKGLIVKYGVRVKLLSPKPTPVSLSVTAEAQSLLQFSATSIAQQMTLLDAELFRQLEPAELLLWAREQSEDFCPALNNFTEHFNKVSYWARTKVLSCTTSRERNRTMKKLIEVMRKLRDYNNFNSLLALLSALDCAPIRRLGFSKRLTEALKPHASLTDSSGSFRTYRQALSESKPPCIPYIGLVLQDLTFVHIGNADFLPDSKVNWIKRWQQWVVLEPIRRFHSCSYGYIRNENLLTFLNNFDESFNDDELWILSEQIKPRKS